MRTLIDSTEDEIPNEIQELNEVLREQYSQRVTSAPELLKGGYRVNVATPPNLFANRSLVEPEAYNRAIGVEPSEGPERGNSSIEPPFPLERWLIQVHAYREGQIAKASFLGRLFSGEVERVKAGVVHEAKWYSIRKTEDLGEVEVGVAVRLSAATSDLKGKFELTLPNLAADAQLNGAESRIGISVVGFVGPLGDILPAPKKLDVNTCGDYMKAFRDIQSYVFGKQGLNYVVPTSLSYEA